MMQNKKDERMGTAPLPSLLLSMALPAMAAQIINVLYSVIDRIYIGNIPGDGDLALTGIGLAAPILMMISAFSALAGSGGAPRASVFLGQKNTEKAEKILGCSTALLLVISAVLTVLLEIIKEPILYLFGASDRTIVYAVEYTGIYLIGTVFVQLALGLNSYISAQGNASIAMLSVLIGAILNILLDPIFIFVLHMGVRGAALATVISQAFSALWVVSWLLRPRNVLRIRPEYIRIRKEEVIDIVSLGISPFVMNCTESMVSITLNSGLARYGGDLYVGSMAIMNSIMMLVVTPVSGMTQGIQPVIGYNFGAGKIERARKAFTGAVLGALMLTMLTGGIAVLFPGLYVGRFTGIKELREITCRYMPLFFACMPFFGIQMACQSTFLAMGKAKISLFIACLRKIILLIPLAVILPHFLGVKGIFAAEALADGISVSTVSVVFMLTAGRQLWGEKK